jgi:hypothetical protein
MKVTVASSDAPSDVTDKQCPDIYFTSGYGTASALTRSGHWRSIDWEDQILLPYIKVGVGAACDVSSPYGYSGIYVAAGCTTKDVQEFWHSARAVWRDEGVVSAFLRFSPLDNVSREAVTALDGLRLTRRGDTVVVSVNGGEGAVWASMEGRSRTAVRKASNAGLIADIEVATREDVIQGSPFRRLYEATMRRVGSDSAYLFDDSYYVTLLRRLGDAVMLATVRNPQNEVVSAALVLTHREKVHYHLSGSTVEGGRIGANNLLLWTVLQWSARSRRSIVHLGGGVTPDDGLFRFKRSFGGVREQFWTGSVILDEVQYESLLRRRAAELSISAEQLSKNAYFPAYRFMCNAV